MSVADLVQRHTGSRQNLTPVNQNSVMTGRRARQEEPPPPPPPSRPKPEPPRPQPPIAAAPDGFAPDPGAPREGPRRPGGQSSYYTIPSEALSYGFPAEEGGFPPAEPPAGFPPDAEPVRRPRPRPRTAPGFPPDAVDPGGSHRVGEAFTDEGGFPPDAAGPRRGARQAGDPRNGRRPGEAPGPRNGFPPEDPPNGFPSADRRNGHRAGEASAHHNIPGTPPDEFPPDGRRNGRRAGEASAHHRIPGDDPRNGRRAGEASAHLNVPGDPNGRRTGEASAHHRIPGDGPRRAGEASAHHNLPGRNGFPPDDPRNPRRVGEASAHLNVPGDPNGFPLDEPRNPRRAGEAPAHHNIPGDNPRNGRRVGEASAHHNVPGDPNGFPLDEPRNGRRPGEASAHHGIPGDDPRNGRVGEASAHHGIPGRPGEGPHGFPPESGPREAPGGRPQGAARRRAARVAGSPPELGLPPGQPNRFPPDAPPQPGQSSGHFPLDDPRRQGPNRPEQLSEPRLTPAAIDAPDLPRPTRSTGVPPVPLPPPRRDDDPISMTTEMAAIGDEIHDEVQKRRSIDHTLARFSAVHDEIRAEEREKKAKRRKLRPWERGEDEMARLDELDAQQSMAMAIPVVDEDDDQFDEEAEEQPAKKKRRWLKGKRGRTAGKAFAIVIAALVFVSTAVAWGFKSYIESSAQTVDALDPNSDAIKDAGAQLGDENFLLVGSDTRAGATAEDGVGDEGSVEGARSDTVMIAHIPKNRERAVVVSFPRDLEVTRPACEGWDPKTGQYTGDQHPAEEQVKLNSAYMVGGPKCVTKLVQELSGLAVNHFVGIDFHGFKDMVQAVDGVEVCVERPMKDDILGVVVPEAGKNVKLTGDQALNFVRARHVDGDITADYGRIIRQQRFLSSLLRKAMSTEVLLNPGKLTGFVNAFAKSTFGDNIGVDQLFTLGQSMQGVDAGRVTFITIPTVGYENERHNEDLRPEDANALFDAIRRDTPLPGESPANPPDQQQTQQQQAGLKQPDQPAGPVDPKTVKIQVLNGGNETDGIARDTADELTEIGFEVLRVDRSPVNVDKTVIKYSKTFEAQAQTLKLAIPGASLEEDPSMSGAIMLIVGPEFDGSVQSPTGGGGEPAPELPENLSTVNAGDVSCA